MGLQLLSCCKQASLRLTSLPEVFSEVEASAAYFPPFLSTMFPHALQFRSHYRDLARARSGIKLIQLKELSPSNENAHQENLSWSKDGSVLGYELVKNRQRIILLQDLARSYQKVLAILPMLAGDSPRTGGASLTFNTYNAFLRWSYDSSQYSFMSNGGNGDFNIYVGELGSGEHLVAQNPAKDGFATWNPRHNELAFTSSRTGQGDLYLIKKGAREHRLTFNPSPDLYPEWTKDGQGLVFVSGGFSQHKIMVVLRGQSTSVWAKPYLFVRGGSEQMRPVMSPNGRYLAFYSLGEQGDWNLHVLPFKRNKSYPSHALKHSVVARKVFLDLNSGVAFSPDSKKLFYVEDNLAKANRIFAYDLTSGQRYLLRTNTAMNHNLIMSRLGVLSFCAQHGAWNRVFVALTNQGLRIQGEQPFHRNLSIKYIH